MGKDFFNQFHYHPQTKKRVDGILLVPKNKQSNIPENKIFTPTVETNEKLIFNEAGLFSKILGVLTAILFIFLFSILPIRILESGSNMNAKAKESFTKLEGVYQSIKQDNYSEAKTDLSTIAKNIDEIDKELNDIGQKNIFVSRFSVLNDTSINDERFFNTVLALSKIGNRLIDDFHFTEKINISSMNTGSPDNTALLPTLEKINQNLKAAENDFRTVKLNIAKINDDKMSDSEKQYFSIIKQNFGKAEEYYNSAIKLTDSAPELLGKDYNKKYLVLFENNTEIRATGGFCGTYGIITIRNGEIKNIFIDSIYNPDGQISKIIEPPEPLKKITNSWAMRDANWYPDFSVSAKNISNFYELEGGFTPDGIIAFDTKPFVDLLKITGPIKLDKYDLEINADNFIPTTQYKTSVDYNPSDNNPKKFLADFAPLLLERLSTQDPDQQKKILSIFLDNIQEKHIQFYSHVNNIQKAFEDLDIAGRIKKNGDSDYFNYINSNIGGLKTNSQITEKIDHEITIKENGKIIHKATLTRKSSSSDINYAYLRFYLPKGSKIIDTKGFEKKESIKRNTTTGMLYLEDRVGYYLGEASVSDLDIYEESGKTVSGAWQALKPGKELVSQITYQLPDNINIKNNIYRILIQKQAGIVNQSNNIKVDNLLTQKNGYSSLELRRDEIISVSLNN